MAFDNLLFDNLILHNCGVTIVDYYSVEKVDDNSCRFFFLSPLSSKWWYIN